MNLIQKVIPSAHAAINQGGPIVGPGAFQSGGPRSGGTNLEIFISTIVAVITVVAGLAFVLYFILGGLTWITAGGDPTKQEKAKKQLTDAAIGFVVVVLAYSIAGIVSVVLGIPILNPATILP